MNMEPNWFLRAENQLCEAVNRGEMSESEFDKEMRSLCEELRDSAEQAAGEAYNDAMGIY